MSSTAFPASPRSQGFSLVEVMVGIVISMLGVLVIMQIFAMAEAQKRTTTGVGDAQSNGAIALYGIQRDVRQAGYGFNSRNLFGCNLTLPNGVTINGLAPVTINYAGIPAGVADTNTDTVMVVYGNGNGAPEGDGITSQPATNTYAVQTPTAYITNDRVVAFPQAVPTPCNLNMDQVTGIASPNVTVTTGVSGMTNGLLFNLGQSPKVVVYAVHGGNLTACDFMANDCGSVANANNAAVWVPIISNIVSLRADYGRDTTTPNMDGIVDAYNQTAPASACDIMRISAVRLAIVSRSSQYDKQPVTANAAPAWAGSANAPIDLTQTISTANEWQHYRYKVFETTMPLRNLVWMGVQAGC